MSDPVITYPPELPVSRRREDIADAIRAHQVVIVAGATGSGKTTQLPKILLELGCRSIGHTQPRRIAARTIAERISEELGQQLGGIVGYQVRFTDTVGRDTRIKLMTDGILLNEIHRDRDLTKYDAIIIDEAHERSLTIDFLLGYLKQLLPRRPDLKVVITSATIDPESFARHFADAEGKPAPIVEVSGRTYPVEIRYRPLVQDRADAGEEDVDGDASTRALDPIEGIIAALDELTRESSGDVLVFLSGEAEIRDAEEAIRGRNLPGTEVLPLYGRLSSADQHRVFRPSTTAGTRRRVVLATNVAETSLTVPGIRYVVDAGMARISRYSVRAKVQRLPIEAISQASANQRSGRSGRTSAGIAIRLYSQEDFESRPEYTEPEILRTNLAAVILQMISLGLGDIAAFPFLQPPDSRGIKDGLDLLRELRAVELSTGATPRITRVGRQLTQLPIDPRLARMVVESKEHGVTREVMAIVAGLSIQDPRERPLERRAQADQSHARFTDKTSDFLTLLNLWNHLREKEAELSSSAFRRLCKADYLNFLRVREWTDVYRQLQRQAKPLGLTVGEPRVDPAGIHKSLLSGLLSQIGIRDLQKKDYAGSRQVRFLIFPGSALAKKQPDAVMTAELVETSRLFARVNAAIDTAWAEPLAGDLVKKTASEPHWEKKQGAVVAWERVTLYGVPIVERRRIQFSRVDPAYARDLFIRNALVDGDWDIDRIDRRLSEFDRANRRLRRELGELEERTRRRDILFDDEAVFEFYSRRVPKDVNSAKSFETWWRKARAETPDLLTMTRENLVEEVADDIVDENAYPSTWQQGDQRLKLGYRFEPGADDDGVTARVPLALLARLTPAGFDWQVPGLREELVAALIRSLPKAIRRNVVPANDWARRLLEGTDDLDPEEFEQTVLPDYLAQTIRRMTHTPVTADDFDLDRVPAHLRVTFAVIDDHGREVARSKDLPALQHKLATRARESVAGALAATGPRRPAPGAGRAELTPTIERSGLTTWDLEDLPRQIDTRHGGGVVRGYPALVDEGRTVGVRVMSTPDEQLAAHRGGVRRLLLLAIPSPAGYVTQQLTSAEKLTLTLSPYRTTNDLVEDAVVARIDQVLEGGELPFTRAGFEAARDAASAGLVDVLFRSVGTVLRVITASRDADKAIKQATSLSLIAPLGDARAQRDALVFPGFVSSTGLDRLPRLPMYLSGISYRIERLTQNPGRDRVWMTEVERATALYSAAGGTLPLAPNAPASLTRARWMLEELRISLFAQPLGTAEPVSVQRIAKTLAA